MAASTLSRVSGRTFGCSFSTRETVWCDTPASRATSAITGGRDRLPAVAGALTRLLAFSPGDDVTPCLLCRPRREALRSAGADLSVNICAGRVAVLASRRPRQRHAPVPAPPGFPVPQSSRRAAKAVARGSAGRRRPRRSGRGQGRQGPRTAGAGVCHDLLRPDALSLRSRRASLALRPASPSRRSLNASLAASRALATASLSRRSLMASLALRLASLSRRSLTASLALRLASLSFRSRRADSARPPASLVRPSCTLS